MASFWNVDGEDLTKTEIKEQDNSFKPLPTNWYQGMVDSLEVKDGEYGKSIRAKLSCKVGNDMKKTSVSLKCWDADPKKRKRAIQMLLLMFRHAGKEVPQEEPDSDNIQPIVGRKMGFHLDVYEMEREDGTKNTGNWLKFVGSSEDAKAKATAEPKEVKKAAPAIDNGDDDIPW